MEEAWCQAMALCRDMRESIAKGKGPSPGTDDWNVMKASLEMIVRWGIYPALSPGVGIPVSKRFQNSAAMESAAAAVVDHVKQARAFSGISRETSEEQHQQQEAVVETLDFLVSAALDQSKNATPLRELVLSHHSPDICAACLDLCFRPDLSGNRSNRALQVLDGMNRELPVSYMMEALFMLQHGNAPAWLLSEAGRMLSRLILRERGVVSLLGALFSREEARCEQAQKKVSTLLARPPSYVATAEQYYSNICSQLRPLLCLRAEVKEGAGESGALVESHIQKACVLTACKVARREPRFVEEFVVRPLLEGLLSEDKLQLAGEQVFGVQALITTGHEGGETLKKMLFEGLRHLSSDLLDLDRRMQSETDVKAALEDINLALVLQNRT